VLFSALSNSKYSRLLVNWTYYCHCIQWASGTRQWFVCRIADGCC